MELSNSRYDNADQGSSGKKDPLPSITVYYFQIGRNVRKQINVCT